MTRLSIDNPRALPSAAPVPAARSRVAAAGVVQGGVDAVLALCPSAAEIAEIRAAFNVTLPTNYRGGFRCPPSGVDPMLVLVNAFRCMHVLRFDAPLPIMGTRTAWDWLQPLHLRYERSTDPAAYTHAGGLFNGNVVTIAQIALSAPYNQWTTPGLGWAVPMAFDGIVDVIGILLHEARHTDAGGGIGHHCSTSATPQADCSIHDGGAYAVEYYWYKWCALHSGTYLTAHQKENAARSALAVRAYFATPPSDDSGAVEVHSR